MSFNWQTNSFGGPNNGRSSVNVSSTFPLSYNETSSRVAHSELYDVPNYLLLGDLSSNQTPLYTLMGGYAGNGNTPLPPTAVPYFHQVLSKVASNGQGKSLGY